jgi:bifunctional UDP-N-acetylglucosamine pyrophosphorylase / glucosamine-1-phosphate N-acetyltransferase
MRLAPNIWLPARAPGARRLARLLTVTNPLHVVVLAAGKGTRMKSARPKVLHRVAGVPMIELVLRTARTLQPRSTTVVVGHGSDLIRGALAGWSDLTFVVQQPQLGTAHALLSTAPVLGRSKGTLLLLSGDVPLLKSATLRSLLDTHISGHAFATVVTACAPDPTGYGRIVRSGDEIARIVEDRDATPAEREIHEINSGIYAFALEGLFAMLRSIAAANAQGEYYLTDLVARCRETGRRVSTIQLEDVNEILGVNSRKELASVTRLVRLDVNDALMASGVTLEDPSATHVDPGVVVGPDTVIHPGVSLEGRTTIGAGCEIHGGVRIVDSTLGDRVIVYDHSLIREAIVGADTCVGPFAHLRQGADLRAGSRVGNFVELKKTVLGPGSKAMHLAYLGDATIGGGVNVGAGVITCNYDGAAKHPTVIDDGAFVGSDSQLVAPVTIGEGAYVGTGTTVREDVPAGALAVSAGRQRNIAGWAKKRMAGAAKPVRRKKR